MCLSWKRRGPGEVPPARGACGEGLALLWVTDLSFTKLSTSHLCQHLQKTEQRRVCQVSHIRAHPNSLPDNYKELDHVGFQGPTCPTDHREGAAPLAGSVTGRGIFKGPLPPGEP